MKYLIHFEFDCEDEAPKVFIFEDGEGDVVEVFEEPTMLTEQFSWDEDDWQAGPLAQKILNYLNTAS